ncbi:MAG: ABC transporter ATP-binding protein [Miltoncostaeaceae bacterium]
MPSPTAPVIRADGVTVRFGALTALSAVDVTVTARATGLLGANGAGKSTLMKCLLGLIRPAAGSLSVLGVEVADGAWDLRRRLGYMPERGCLPRDMTARDFVVHMGELRGLDHRTAVLRASEVLFQVGLEEERSRLIGTFSTGMTQRTKLAQALVHSPDLVILDEPTNGLDPAGREEMLTLVRRLSRELDIAVLMSSHVLEDITRTCDAVVVLRDGTVAHDGPIDDLRDGVAEGGLRVVLGGDVDRVAALLTARGLGVTPGAAGELAVTGAAPDALADAIRDALADAGASLHALRPAGRTIEEALVEVLS